METLPVETFQLVCSFCSLHTLAILRLVSKGFRDRVDGSITARRSHSTPSTSILAKGEHDTEACYVRVTISRQHDPITAVFNRYHPKHNYIEFVQLSEPVVIEGGPIPQQIQSQAHVFQDSTLGKLDLNLWQEQFLQFKNWAAPPPPPPPSSGEGSVPAPRRTARRSSITEASQILTTGHMIQQELSSGGPITPLAQTRPIRNAMSASLGTSNPSLATLPSRLPRDDQQQAQGQSYMARFARMVLGASATDSQLNQTRPGMSAAELIEEARQLIHSVEPEILSSRKQYKFTLSVGVHYIGDNDFIMKYTVSQDSSSRRLLKVDYIRASWKWITSGIPVRTDKTTSTHEDPLTVEDPFPEQRIGRIYAERSNRLLQEIKKQKIDKDLRGYLALDGYDLSVLPRTFISINLRSEPVLKWITRLDQDEPPQKSGDAGQVEALLDEGSSHPLNNPSGDDGTIDSDWEDLSSQGGKCQDKDKGKDREESVSEMRRQDEEDQEALEELVQSMKQNMGFLIARNVFEEMLTSRGYSRELVWKYGFIRRVLMGPVPNVEEAKLLVQKVIDSEGANRTQK